MTSESKQISEWIDRRAADVYEHADRSQRSHRSAAPGCTEPVGSPVECQIPPPSADSCGFVRP